MVLLCFQGLATCSHSPQVSLCHKDTLEWRLSALLHTVRRYRLEGIAAVCVAECSHYSHTVRNQDEILCFKLVSGWQRGVKSHQILLNPFRALGVSSLFIVAGRYVRMLLRHGKSSLCEWNHSASVSVSCLRHSACIAATLALLPSARFDWDQQKGPSLLRGGIFEVTVQIW